MLGVPVPLEFMEVGAVKRKTDKRKPSQERCERILDVGRALFEAKGY